MADKSIVELQKVEELQPQSSIPVYQDGTAQRVTGEQLVQMANVETKAQIEQATNAATRAAASAESAKLSATEASQVILNSPKIQDGTWWVFNQQTSTYQDTGVAATGPQGPMGGVDNYVRYDAAQSLTDGQKTQARDNIGAAPSGFGLGEERAHEVISDCNNAKLSGLYIMSSATVNYPPLIRNGQYSLLRVSARTSTEILQEVFCCGISGQYDFSAVRSYVNTGSWSPWEYINPPMQLGVEYRTTERYLGKPVYVKVVDCGSCPADGYKDVVYAGAYTVTPIRCEGTWSYNSGSTIPFESTDEDQLHIGALGNTIRVKTGGKDFSSYTYTATVYYTKVTD